VTAAVLPPLASRESPNQSSRGGHAVHLVVVHRPAGGYQTSIDWLCRKEADASAHVITKLGGHEATQLVHWDRKAWSCVHLNPISDNIEVNDEVWSGHDPLGFAVAARIVAFRLHARGLPAHWVRSTELAHGRGFTRHHDLGLLGGGHTDPTEDLTLWHRFCTAVQHELERGGFRKDWGR
jgi:hypothetical protein